MKHTRLNEIEHVADLSPAETRQMIRRERLERWATALERHKGVLKPLYRVEYVTPAERAQLRGDDTPLSVAFADPVLRSEGLASDRLGDAKKFFELSEHEAHYLLCDCHYGGTMTGEGVASRIRGVANRMGDRGLWDRACEAVMGRW